MGSAQRVRRPWGSLCLPGLAVVLYLALRVPWLGSIPGYGFDEGLLGLAAKNWITLRDPLFGQNFDLLRFPLFTTILAGAYSLFGHSILVSRWVSIAAGLTGLFVFMKLAYRLVPRTAAQLAILMYAVDCVLVRYQRYGLAESTQLLLLICVVGLWLHPGKRRYLSCGLTLGLAILQKPTSLCVVPALVWLDWQAARESRCHNAESGGFGVAWRPFVPYLLAILLVGTVYGMLWAAWPSQFADAWRIYVGHPLQLGDMPRTASILLIGSPVAVLGALALPLRLRSGPSREVRFLCMWLALGFLFLCLQKVHPVRYYVTLMPPALLAGALLVDSLASGIARHGGLRGSQEGRARRIRLAFGVALVAYALGSFALYYHFLGHRDQTGRKTAAWLEEHVPESCVVLGFPQLGVDAPHRYLEATSIHAMIVSEPILSSNGIQYVLYDDAEWRRLSESKGWCVEDSLRKLCEICERVEGVEIWHWSGPRGGSAQ